MKVMGFVILERAKVTQVIKRAPLGFICQNKPDHVLPQVRSCATVLWTSSTQADRIVTMSKSTAGKERIPKEPSTRKPGGHEGLPLSDRGDNQGESRKLHISFDQKIKITT